MKLYVSIGIPFYNSERFLATAIYSVINQSYSNWKLFLIDDGSQDSSLKIAEYFAKDDHRITVISDGVNKGLPYRLNELSMLADGKYYFRMDADDIMHPDRVLDQITFLKRNPQVDLVGSGLISIDNDNQILGKRKGLDKFRYSLHDVIHNSWSVHPTIAGKTEWFKNNKYDPNLKRGQDYDLWIRTIEKSYFSKIPKPLLFYRESSTPSLLKYWKSTKNTIKCYWKNRNILGFKNVLIFTITKIIKLHIYLVYSVFGLTNKLIKNRSTPMNHDNFKKYQGIINKIENDLRILHIEEDFI